MKPLFLILISFFLLSFDGDKRENDLEREHLKGNIKSVITIDQLHGLKYITKYNNVGNIVDEVSYGSGYDSAMSYDRTIYFYDKNNRLLNYKITSLKQITNDSCKYNIDGKLTCNISYDGDGNIIRKDSSFYDGEGNKILIIGYNIDENNQWREAYKDTCYYDKENYLIGYYLTEYIGNDTLHPAVDYKNYSNGEVKQASYFENRHCTSRFNTKYEKYDDKGNWTISMSYEEIRNERDTNKREIEYYK